MKLKDFLSDESLDSLFENVLEADGDQPDLPGIPAAPAAAQKPRVRHTRIPGKVGNREFDHVILQQKVKEAAILAIGYKKFTKDNLAELKSPPYPVSNSSGPVHRDIREGKYFVYENQRYVPVAVYSHPNGMEQRGLLNKVLIRRDDGQFYVSSETICMKWIKAQNPTWETVLAFARGMAAIEVEGGVEDMDGHVSNADKREVLSVFHQIDSQSSKVNSMGVDENIEHEHEECPHCHNTHMVDGEPCPYCADLDEGDGGIYGPNAGGDEHWEPNEMGQDWDPDHGVYGKRELPDHGHEVAESVLSEKWGKKIEPSTHKGKWTKYTIAELEKKLKALRGKEERTKAEQKKVSEIVFAIRAKKAKGKKWKGVTAESKVTEGDAGVYGETGGGNEVYEPNDYTKPGNTAKMNESVNELGSALNELRKNAGIPLKG